MGVKNKWKKKAGSKKQKVKPRRPFYLGVAQIE